MEQNQMKIDPNTLEIMISFIERYSVQQKEVLERYTSRMKSLSNEWDDPKGYNEMIKNLETVTKRSQQIFEQIRTVYKKFYYDEMLDIRRNLNSIKV